MEWLLDPEAWVALATLTALEIVLGIDNIIFISIMVGRLPPEQRQKARLLGLSLAMFTRIALLLSLAWIMGLTASLFEVYSHAISGRDLILIIGGLFLLAKSSLEIHHALEGDGGGHRERVLQGGFMLILVQIALIDIVFSLDSVITAVGLVQHIPVMVIAIVLAVLVMMLAAKPISDFIDRHPSLKMLALSFLVLIGSALVAEGFDVHIPKGYLYFAMAFSVLVELLNIRLRRRSAPVTLHKRVEEMNG